MALAATDRVASVAFFPDRNEIALASDSTVRVWDYSSNGQAISASLENTSSVWSIVASPGSDGKLKLASGSEDGTLRIWESWDSKLKGASARLLVHAHEGTIGSVAFSRDGSRIVHQLHGLYGGGLECCKRRTLSRAV